MRSLNGRKKIDSEIRLAYLYKLQPHKFVFKDENYTLDDLRVTQPKQLVMNGLRLLDKGGNLAKDINQVEEISAIVETTAPIEQVEAELVSLGLKVEVKVNHMLVARIGLKDIPQISKHSGIKYIWLGRLIAIVLI